MHILNTHELGYSFAQLALPVGKNRRHLTGVSFETASNELAILPLPVDSSSETMNEVAYFNAIAAALTGDRLRFEEWFQTALSISEPFE